MGDSSNGGSKAGNGVPNGGDYRRQGSFPPLMPVGDSPLPALREFSVAKQSIASIFDGFTDCIARVSEFLQQPQHHEALSAAMSRSNSSEPSSPAPHSASAAAASMLSPVATSAVTEADSGVDLGRSPSLGFSHPPVPGKNNRPGQQNGHLTVDGAGATGVDDGDVILAREREIVDALHDKASKIRDAVSRDAMKVVLVGRTSTGKSTTINALLHRRILPSGVGHTTNCFCCLVGTKADTPYLQTAGSAEKLDVADVKHLAHALYPEGHLASDALVYLHWPATLCSMLSDDVVIIDSPGLDISSDSDHWIDEYCSDADVFVLVANAESTLNVTEKRFFRKVQAKLSRPNVFIEYNRWDCIDHEDTEDESPPELVKKQHLQNAASLLVDELRMISKQQLEDRVFFVSAREVLSQRVKPKSDLAPGVAARLRSFEAFERAFAECISRSAIKTRFEMHVEEGATMASELTHTMELIAERARKEKLLTTELLSTQRRHLQTLQERRQSVVLDCEDTVRILEDTLTSQVASALNEQAALFLEKIVMDFDGEPFTPVELGPYKKLLNAHVKAKLSDLVSTRSMPGFQDAFDCAQQRLYDSFGSALPPETDLEEQVPRRPFSMQFILPGPALTEGFREDLEFRFSLSWSVLAPKLLGPNSTLGPAMRGWVPPFLLPRAAPASEGQVLAQKREDQQGTVEHAWMMGLDVVCRFLQSPAGTVALTVASMFISKTWTMKVAVVGGVGIGGLYLWERASYTAAAKERRFKRQYVKHATAELQSVSRHVGLYSQGVARELSQQLNLFKATTSSVEDQLSSGISSRHEALSRLEATTLQAEQLHKEIGHYGDALRGFATKYLCSPDDRVD
eukprot:m.482126 g.482126  ORF g.482126 m.482126 type:complete len:857 (+) comp22427_c0_seq1:365-2935(+)